MPLEGHWARQQRPFLPTKPRELFVFVVVGAMAALLTALIAWAVLIGSTQTAEPGCRYKNIASTTGAATYKVCNEAQSTDK
jgi:hypothetical protein